MVGRFVVVVVVVVVVAVVVVAVVGAGLNIFWLWALISFSKRLINYKKQQRRNVFPHFSSD